MSPGPLGSFRKMWKPRCAVETVVEESSRGGLDWGSVSRRYFEDGGKQGTQMVAVLRDGAVLGLLRCLSHSQWYIIRWEPLMGEGKRIFCINWQSTGCEIWWGARRISCPNNLRRTHWLSKDILRNALVVQTNSIDVLGCKRCGNCLHDVVDEPGRGVLGGGLALKSITFGFG